MRLKRILGGAGVIALAAVGIQLATVQAASAHTPSADITCTGWSIAANNYEAAQNNTYSYSIDGATAVTGTFKTEFAQSGTFAPGSGNHTLVGYVYQDNNPNATYSKTYHLSTPGCVSYIPIPAAPVPTPPSCTAAGTATIPDNSDSVHWTLDGAVATATAQGDNTFSDGSKTETFTETVLPKLDSNSDACVQLVSPVAPDVAQATCDHATGANNGFSITPATTPGIAYTVEALVVTATAESGNKLATLPAGWTRLSDTVATYTVTPTDQLCLIDVSPVAPDVAQATCDHATGIDSGYTITPAITDGLTYTVDGLVVTATATDGFKLGALPTDWTSVSDTVATYTVTRTDPLCLIGIATSPTFTDDVCRTDATTGSSVVVPATIGVDFLIDGVDTTAGTHPATDGSTVTVTAHAQPGYTLTGPTSWSHTFSARPTCAEVDAVHIITSPTPQSPATTGNQALAVTGVPTVPLALLGGLLAIAGAAMCLGGTRRRWFRG